MATSLDNKQQETTPTPVENQGVAAWLLEVVPGIMVAVGQFEVIHIVDRPEYFAIPHAPKYCSSVVMWNDKIVPVLDLPSWLTGHEQPGGPDIVAIVAYQSVHDEYLYGGIGVSSIPALCRVTNEQFCELPDNTEKWHRISLSCFKSEKGQVVPVLNLASIFSSGLFL